MRVAKCSNKGRLDMAFDATATLELVHSCPPKVTLLTQNLIYPSGYSAACDAVATTLCADACNCPRGAYNTCCVTDGKQFECDGTAAGCAFGPDGVRRFDCGNASQDPAVLYACRDALSQTACVPDGGAGALVPTACTSLYH